MKTIIIASHPNFSNSLSQLFLFQASKVPKVIYHLIDGKNIDLTKELEHLSKFDRIIFQFPLYWYGVPAKLKEWIDMIWQEAEFILKGKELGIAISTGMAEKEFQIGGKEEYSLSELLTPLIAMGKKYHMVLLPIFVLDQLMYKNEEEKKIKLVEYQQLLTMQYPFNFKHKQEWFLKQLSNISDDSSKIKALQTHLRNNYEKLNDIKEILRLMEENKWNYGQKNY